ncbi:MAG: hypothetical protein GY798_25385 [Hyphomicrobiales bacterium]|nr:hypothetical protein [Hyphomicrobiales bacterium]
MTSPTPSDANRHPLEVDVARLERIATVMCHEIHKKLGRPTPPRRRTTGSDVSRVFGEPATERIVRGSALSAEYILSEAIHDLLAKSPDEVTESWEALAVRIAQNKAIGAVRAAGAGLRPTEHRPRLTVVSPDAEGPIGPDGEPGPSALEYLESSSDPEAEFFATAQQDELLKLARETLDERDRAIFMGIHYGTRTRVSLAEEFDLSPPGVTHVYKTIALKLYQHPRFQRFAQEEPRDH